MAVSVRLRLRRTASWTKRNWCRFMAAAVEASLRRRAAIAAITRRCSPTARAASSATPGWRARSCSTSSGRSWRTWPPAAEEQRQHVDARAAGGGQLGRGRRQVGRISSRKASAPARPGAARAPARRTASNGAAQRGSRAPWANRIRPRWRAVIGTAPARRTRPSTAAGRAGSAPPPRPTASSRAARRCGPTTLFSSTKLMPSMMPPKTLKLMPPARACR